MDTVKLLGNSQTFIGVLATIVILCVVTGSGNFLFSILIGIADIALKKIKQFKDNLEGYSDTLKNGPCYKEFLKRLEQIKKSACSEDLTHKANQYSVLCDISISEFTNKFNSTFLVPFERRIIDIKESKEQTFAPLLVFGYCIVVFICDEIVAWCPAAFPYVLIIIKFFTILSFLFLSCIWYKFYIEFCSESNIAKENSATHIKISMKNIFFYFFIKFFFPFLLILISLYFIAYFIDIPVALIKILIVIGTVIPFCFLGRKQIKIRTLCGKYSHSFLLWHFCIIFAISLIYTLMVVILSYYLITAELLDSSQPYKIQMLIIIFVLLFGIILPFLVPYLSYRKIEEQVENNYKILSKNLVNELQGLTDDIVRYTCNLEGLIEDVEYELLLGLDCDIEFMVGCISQSEILFSIERMNDEYEEYELLSGLDCNIEFMESCIPQSDIFLA